MWGAESRALEEHGAISAAVRCPVTSAPASHTNTLPGKDLTDDENATSEELSLAAYDALKAMHERMGALIDNRAGQSTHHAYLNKMTSDLHRVERMWVEAERATGRGGEAASRKAKGKGKGKGKKSEGARAYC